MKLKRKQQFKFDKKDLMAIGLMILAFVILLQYRSYKPFLDESDNFVGGKIWSRGGIIYKDFISQHMPGMYYLVGLIIKIGFTGSVGIRSCFYCLIFISWIVMYFRYRDLFLKWVIPTFSLMYLAMFNASMGYTILAEQVQIISFMIIICEFFLFLKNKSITIVSAVLISISSWAAISCAMTSSWPIGFMALLFIVVYVNEIKKGADVKRIIIEIVRTGIIIVVPFILWMIYMWKTNSIDEWFYESYTFNQEVYSKYNDFSGILKTIINPLLGYGSMIWNSIQNLTTSIYSNVRTLAYVVINILFCIEIGKKEKIYGILMFIITVTIGSRSFAGWSIDLNMHATPYLAITGFMLAYLLFEVWNNKRTTIIVTVLLMIIPIAASLNDVSVYNSNTKNADKSYTQQYIDILTKKNEKIFLVEFGGFNDYTIYDRMPAARLVHIHPWFVEKFQQDVIDDLEKNKPRLIVNNENMEIWGHKYTEYAASLRNYILQNYTQIGKAEANVWVRNDYYKKALKKIKFEKNKIVPDKEISQGALTINNTKVSESFTPKVNNIIKISTYITVTGDVRDGYFMMDLYSKKDNKCIYSGAMPISTMVDGWQIFELNNIEVIPDNEYEVKISVAGVPETCAVNIGVIKDNSSIKTEIDEKSVDQDLAIRVYGNNKMKNK